MTVDDALPLVNCVLLDISQTGARLEVPATADLASEFVLVFNDNLQRWCRVVRRTKRDVGVRFITTRRAKIALV